MFSILSVYEPILRKLVASITTLERESEIVFRHKVLLQDVMKSILTGLNTNRECAIPVDEANTIYLKPPLPLFPASVALKEHCVPILMKDPSDSSDTAHISPFKEWDSVDLVLQQILPHIDGVNHLLRIAQVSGVEIKIVKNCVQHLLYYRCVRLMDLFQTTNIYCTTPQARQFAFNKKMQHECLRFICKSALPQQHQQQQNNLVWPPSFVKVFSLYCELGSARVPVGQFAITHELESLNIDIRRFVAFGVLNGILRRVHKYPLKLTGTTAPLKVINSFRGKHEQQQQQQQQQQQPQIGSPYHFLSVPQVTFGADDIFLSAEKRQQLSQMLDGQTCYDQICCTLFKTVEEIDAILLHPPGEKTFFVCK